MFPSCIRVLDACMMVIERGNLKVKVKTIIEDVLIGCGITISLIDIQQILSIVLLCFNVLWLLWKFGYRVYQHFKNKQYEKIESDIKETIDGLEQLTDKTKDSDKEQ